ncbi:protein of unknown function [Fodinibius roseus]|uniref:DUF4365 domain-containing protein n=1 Tax=Fodinibius roseus TaxID=1194090 RepID=A0A1M5IAR0_9BACT|nr:DUF4365 domain-containing protein [Fodinibius roseus]SHG24863.1 protein of unknown function [Fodinibius roseus]
MGKIVNESHIVGKEGVNAFERYCLEHKPTILWREENVNDFGIDGEVELTRVNERGKEEVTGKIIKVQIKSSKYSSYIFNEDDTSFKFRAKSQDYEYWENHNLDVVLVYYDANNKKLYGKKITPLQKEKFKKTVPIEFSKKENLLRREENNFTSKFGDHLLPRLEFGVNNKLISNIFPLVETPKSVYVYKSKYKNFNKILKLTKGHGFPIISLRSDEIVLITKPTNYSYFNNNIIKKKIGEYRYEDFINDKENRKRIVEIYRKLFGSYCNERGIGYNKKFRRYYFLKNADKKNRKESYEPRLSKQDSVERSVVKFMNYYGINFYKHDGFSTYFLYINDRIYITIIPRLLYTEDGEKPLDDKKLVTKLAGYIKSRKFNNHVVNDLYFLFKYLSKGGNRIYVANFGNCKFCIGKSMNFEVNYGIRKKKNEESSIIDESDTQKELFE